MGIKAAFAPLMGELTYDPNEIEHPMYMFDHRCVGCVVLVCKTPVCTEKAGEAFLDEKKLPLPFFFTYKTPDIPAVTLLGIYVRGFAEYGRKYKLTLRGFREKSGEELEEMEFILTTACEREEAAGREAHDIIALQAAREGMVLLKNEDNCLPLPQGSILNLFGEGITNYRLGATGAGRINPRYAPDLRRALRRYSSFKCNPALDRFYTVPTSGIPNASVLMEAKSMNDTAVMIITRATGENIDNQPIQGEYYLSVGEELLLERLCQVFEKVVVVLNTGYPIDMSWERKHPVTAILYAGLAGQASARALLEILEGKVNPSGKLSDTWAWNYFDHPSSANFFCPPDKKPILADADVWADTFYEEGIYVGYRYFDTFKKPVAFPFGHGLSYTTFEIKFTSMEQEEEKMHFSFRVMNTGSVSGKEVLLFYAGLPGTLTEQPLRQLISFEKTKLLAPGEQEEIILDISHKQLASYIEEENAWILEPGSFSFYVGGSIEQAQSVIEWMNPQKKIMQKLLYRLPLPCNWKIMSCKGKKWPEGKHTGPVMSADGLTHRSNCTLPKEKEEGAVERKEKKQVISYGMLIKEPELLNDFVSQMSTEELCRLVVMYGSGWGMENKGEAGRLSPIEKYGLPEYACADGNNGVNVKRPNIGMPTSVIICSSFNKTLARHVGRVIGEEAEENGIRMILAPAMNIHRNPLNGRHPEYFSEDPYLTGKMAAAQMKGLHDAGVADCVKHIACNNCETSRKRNHSLVGERALREIYLRAFTYLMEEEMPDTIMTGYNALNGSMCGENEILMEGIFREEMGFDGFAMTDWNSYDTVDMIAAVNAGISWLTPGENDGSRVEMLMKAVQSGRLTREVLERNVRRMFWVFLRREKK